MNELIQNLKAKIKSETTNETAQEQERDAVEFLSSVDFSDPQNRDNGLEVVKYVLEECVEKDLPISSLDAKIVHCIVTKISLDKLGLKDVKINYLNKEDYKGNAGAFYSDSDDSVNFFNENVCNQYDWLSRRDRTAKEEVRVSGRLNHFIYEVFKIEHEIQHAVQFKNMHKLQTSLEDLTPDNFIMSRQHIARTFSQIDQEKSKYFKEGLDVDRLYHDNHDLFYYELDADKRGIERMLVILGQVSAKAYEQAIGKNNRYEEKLETKKKLLENYSDVKWQHNTNPQDMAVNANHKTSMIIDYVLPELSQNQRYEIMQTYPALKITNKDDGSLKSLEEILIEQDFTIDQLLKNGGEEAREQASNLTQVYKAAIENHPVLCFENCLRNIVILGSEFDKLKSLKSAKEKALAIATYMEYPNAKQLKFILDKYRKQLLSGKKHDKDDLRFFQEKKKAIFELDSTIRRNEEFKESFEEYSKGVANAKQKSQEQKENEEQKVNGAQEVLNKVFPGFNPRPQTAVVKDGYVEISNNGIEKLMLIAAYNQYRKTIEEENINQNDEGFIKPSKLIGAIEAIYAFIPTREDREQYGERLMSGALEIIPNVYQVELTKQSSNNEKAEEIIK